MKCQRCGKEAKAHTMSMFNLQTICLPCKDIEKKHPKYEKACEAELEAIRGGNYNFNGIGWDALTYEERIAWFVKNYYEQGMEYESLLVTMKDEDLDNFQWYDEVIKFPKYKCEIE
jgi:hypothetical protein